MFHNQTSYLLNSYLAIILAITALPQLCCVTGVHEFIDHTDGMKCAIPLIICISTASDFDHISMTM